MDNLVDAGNRVADADAKALKTATVRNGNVELIMFAQSLGKVDTHNVERLPLLFVHRHR